MKYVIDKDFENIDIDDIRFLVNNKIAENLSIDYKVQNYDKTNSGKKELLKDVTAFANSSGGDLIIGVGDDKYNQASFIKGIEVNNIAEEVNRIEQIIYSGTEPKLNTFKVKYIRLNNYSNKYLIIIRVGASPIFPHMISFQRVNKFYIRKSDKNILLDAYELRNIFLKSHNNNENIRGENKQRITKIYSGKSVVPINETSPKLLINFIPYSIINNDKNILNISSIKLDFPEQRINFDGVLAYKTDQNGIESYCQIYRNGILEFVSTTNKIFSHIKNPFGENDGEVRVIFGNSDGFEQFIIEKCEYFYNTILKNLNVEFPIYLFINLLDVKGYRIYYKKNNCIKLTNSIDRDLLELPEIELKNYDISIKNVLQNNINLIWNACGEEKSMNII